MHKTAAETVAFLDVFLPLSGSFEDDIDVAIAPPFTSLSAAHERLRGQRRISLAAQNVHWEPQGAFTGEISIPMLAEAGVRYTIVGHSERRQHCCEADAACNLKVKALLAHGMTPILAVGETFEERRAGKADERLASQTRAGLSGLQRTDVARVVVAYEPIWAIGTGHNCDPVEADRAMSSIRACVDGLSEAPLLYGGSMKLDNVAAYMAQPNINGGLVGGASLDPAAFAALVIAARPA